MWLSAPYPFLVTQPLPLPHSCYQPPCAYNAHRLAQHLHVLFETDTLRSDASVLSHLAGLSRARPLLTFALIVEVARLLVPHFDGRVLVDTGDIVHRLWLFKDDLVISLAPSHCTVLQGPGLIHLRQKTCRVFTSRSCGDPSSVLSGPPGPYRYESQKAASFC